jgi:hypothetical protein
MTTARFSGPSLLRVQKTGQVKTLSLDPSRPLVTGWTSMSGILESKRNINAYTTEFAAKRDSLTRFLDIF